MESSPSPSSSSESCSSASITVPIEIISDEEMAFLKAALASTRLPLLSCSSPSRFPPISLAISSSTRHATSISSSSPSPIKDIEDSHNKFTRPNSFLHRFRARRALTVTDITSSEWCQKQTAFGLIHGKPKKTAAMEAGSNRHSELEKEVMDKTEIRTNSLEESWALKFFNFIVCTRQLLFEGLTREIPVIGVYEKTWITGVIDEVRMPIDEHGLNPILVDTKTRQKATLPSEAQKRNARLQLMCYKYLWDGLVANTFHTQLFYKHFELDPHHIISEDIRKYSTSLGFESKTFEDVVAHFRDTCSFLCPSNNQLLLRYELQSDCSLLEEHQFAYDAGWLKDEIEESLKFWSGEEEANYVPKDESWKCRFCKFRTMCPMTSTPYPEPDNVKKGMCSSLSGS